MVNAERSGHARSGVQGGPARATKRERAPAKKLSLPTSSSARGCVAQVALRKQRSLLPIVRFCSRINIGDSLSYHPTCLKEKALLLIVIPHLPCLLLATDVDRPSRVLSRPPILIPRLQRDLWSAKCRLRRIQSLSGVTEKRRPTAKLIYSES